MWGRVGRSLLNRDRTMHSGTDRTRTCNKQAGEAGGAGVEVRLREGPFAGGARANLHGLRGSSPHVYQTPCLPAEQILSSAGEPCLLACLLVLSVFVSVGETFRYLQHDL